MTIFLSHPFFLAAAAGHGEQRATIFFAQVLLLIAVGRLLGEWMQRIGQPAVIGQLFAGIILGLPKDRAISQETFSPLHRTYC
jgi:Kef-type K+ transport system membrane component KefB